MGALSNPVSFSTSVTDPGDQDRVWAWRAVWLIAGVLLLRIGYTALVPVDLVADEAYYWDWSRRLDWGYYSKPPLIAWLIRAATELGGSTTFVVRLPAALLGTGVLVWMYLLARRLYGAAAGFWTVLLAAATPGHGALSLLMTIDAPAIFFWSAALYAFWRGYEHPTGGAGWLAASSLAVGLGLLSKQTTLAILPLAAVFLASTDRRWLARPGFWLWSAAALSFWIPVLWWNSHHDWITLEHTTEHFQAAPTGWSTRAIRWAEFVASILGVSSPLTGVWAALCGGVAMWSIRTLGRRERFLLCFSFLPLSAILGLAAVQRVQPNWPAPFFVLALILTVGMAWGRCEGLRWRLLNPRHLAQAAAVGVVCMLLTYATPFATGWAGSKLDPVVRLRGWRELGQAVGDKLATLPHASPTVIVAVTARDAASELAFYVPQQPAVYLWNGDARVDCQYDVWGGPPSGTRGGMLLVTYPQAELPPELAAGYEELQDWGEVRVEIGNGRCHHYRLWYGVRTVDEVLAWRNVNRS